LESVQGPIVVVDEDRLFKGYETFQEVLGTYGMVWTRDVTFYQPLLQFNKPIASCFGMIKNKKNVPVDPKAEYYLLSCGLPVYQNLNHQVLTRMPLLDGDYTVTAQGNEALFCLKTRSNVFDVKYGKHGDLKKIGEDISTFNGPCYSCNDENERIDLYDPVSYSDPYILRDPQMINGIYFGFHPKPEIVRYMLDTNGHRSRLVFMYKTKCYVRGREEVVGSYKLYHEVYGVNQAISGIEVYYDSKK